MNKKIYSIYTFAPNFLGLTWHRTESELLWDALSKKSNEMGRHSQLIWKQPGQNSVCSMYIVECRLEMLVWVNIGWQRLQCKSSWQSVGPSLWDGMTLVPDMDISQREREISALNDQVLFAEQCTWPTCDPKLPILWAQFMPWNDTYCSRYDRVWWRWCQWRY